MLRIHDESLTELRARAQPRRPFIFLTSLLITASTALTLFGYQRNQSQALVALESLDRTRAGDPEPGSPADSSPISFDVSVPITTERHSTPWRPEHDAPRRGLNSSHLFSNRPPQSAGCMQTRVRRPLPLASSLIKDDVFQPTLPGRPASLLWGEQIGFARRCSRGIIAVPQELLGPWPTIAGIDGRGIHLACGVLTRNKRLDASSLICNLSAERTLAAFEEHSVF